MEGHSYKNVPRIGMYREGPGCDIVKQGYLKKLKTMKKKYFVLRSTSSSGPARLDYYDNEKKFKSMHPPKKSIQLHTCFNINKKSDTKHKFTIALYLNMDCFSIITESQAEQDLWLSLLLEFQNEYLVDGENVRLHYDQVWQGTIKNKSPSSLPHIAGAFRLCLSDKSVVMVKVNEYQPSYTFQFSSIRRCGHSDNFFFMEVGRSSVTGSGELWMQVDDTPIAQSMHDAVLTIMSASRAAQPDQPSSFRRRSNTSGSNASSHQRNTFHCDDMTFHRKRATSESIHNQGSPRRNRAQVMQRPQSSVVFSPKLTPDLIPPGSSPGSAFDHEAFMEETRIRSDSMGSRKSYSSRHSDHVDNCYDHPTTPSLTPENSFCMNHESDYSITEEDQSDYQADNSDYLPMTPGQRSMTPSPTRGQSQMEKSRQSDYLSMTPGRRSGTPSPTRGQVQMERSNQSDYLAMTPGRRSGTPSPTRGQGQMERSNQSDYLAMTPGRRSGTPSPTRGQGQMERSNQSDYLPMTPGRRSGTPSPTRHIERPGSSGSESQEMGSRSEGYMDMRPGSSICSPASNHSGYLDMTPSASHKDGYIDMTPGQRTPTDPAPGYMVMDGGRIRTTAPIPIRTNKEPGYMDMGSSSQPLPTVKEGGSGEAYLPMSPTGHSPVSSANLKPAKVFSYLSDDSMSGEFPMRAYSVGSRPAPKQTARQHQHQEQLHRQAMDSSKSSSAPHLIVQKSRSSQVDQLYKNMSYLDSASGSTSLSQSVKSDDCDSFMEMDFYRQRTASDSYGCRPRASSFGKQYTTPQGHRPRASSYGQASRGKLGTRLGNVPSDSFDSVKGASQDLSSKKWSQESLGIFSSSSRNSSNDSLKKFGEEHQNKNKSSSSDYMDMQCDKRKTPSPHVQGVAVPKSDRTGYVDMTLGTSAPKSYSRGMSPSSSTHSLASSPGSVGHGHHDKNQDTKVIKASGKVVQKQTFVTHPHTSENQLKVSSSLLKKNDKRSPSSSGKESEDESYVPFQPISNTGQSEESSLKSTALSHGASQDKTMSRGSSHDKTVSHGTSHDRTGWSHGYSHDRSPSFSNDRSRGASRDKSQDISQKGHLEVKVQHGYSKSLDSAMKSPEAGKVKSHSKFDIFKSKKDDKHKSKQEEDKKHQEKQEKHEKHEKREKHGNKQSPKMDKSKMKEEESFKAAAALQEKVAMGQSPTLERKIEFIPDSDLFSNKMFLENTAKAKPGDKASAAASNSANTASDESSYMSYSPGFEATLPQPVKSKNKPEETKLKNPPASTNAFQKPHRHADRLYDEIDFSPSVDVKSPKAADVLPNAEIKSPKTSVKPPSESNYMDADPSQDVKSSETTAGANNKSKHENFSYMDFDPGSEMATESENSEPIKAPVRVKSFVAHIESVGEMEITTEGQGQNLEDICQGHCDNRLENAGCVEENKGKTDYVNSGKVGQFSSCSEKDNQKGGKSEGHTTSDIKNVIWEVGGQKRDSKGAMKLCSVDEANTFIIKQCTPASACTETDLLQDEGYVDLDFSEKESTTSFGKGHNRSGSSSSNNSDRSRKIADSALSDDKIRCPDTPVSYIYDDTTESPVTEKPKSYISDDSHTSDRSRHSSNNSSETSPGIKEAGSPWKQQFPGKFSANVPASPPPKSIGCGLAASGVGDSTALKALPNSKVFPAQPLLSLNISGHISRQSSVPVTPSYNRRTSGERTRKASGPPNFPSCIKTGNANSGASGVVGNVGLPKGKGLFSLEPMAPNQELHKQNSVPCMTPLIAEKTKIGDSLNDIMYGQSRHSFTDLSQYEYEEMSFPDNKRIESRSNSQQLVTDICQNDTKLNYAELELAGSTENMDEKSPRIVKSRHPSSIDDLSQTGSPVSYAEIDYLKTESMKNANIKDVKFTL